MKPKTAPVLPDEIDSQFHGFSRIDRHRFYGEVWPRIRKAVEAIESNWKTFRQTGQPLLIRWGDPETKETVAITWSHQGDERHYILSRPES
jgi:hypothetical protein